MNQRVTVEQSRFTSPLIEGEAEALGRVSDALEQGYRELTGQVVRLTAELEAARLARREELEAKALLLERFATVLDALPGGVLIIGETGLVTESNPQAIEMLGDPVDGVSWESIKARGHFVAQDVFCLAGRRFSVSLRDLSESETVVLFTDITSQHTLQRELGRKSRLSALGEMAARLAHQIRTPLSSTMLYVDQLRTDIAVEKRERICEALSIQLSQTEHLISSMLGFVRGSSRDFKPASIQSLVDLAVRGCDASIKESDVTFSLDLNDSGLEVLGDAAELASALGNVIENAINASGAGGRIELWAGQVSNKTLLIQISDNGSGIPVDALEHVFDPFYTTRANGTGLGLAVLASVVQQHGGTVHAANRAGGGAEFSILLPIVQASEIEQ